VHTFIETKKYEYAKMNIGLATEYRNTSQIFIGVNLLKTVGVGPGAPEKFSDVVL